MKMRSILVLGALSMTATAATVVQTVHPAKDVVIAEAVFKPAAEDCSTALQAQLDAVGAKGGGTVFLPVGAYTLAKPVEIPVGVVLRGDRCAKEPAKGTVLRIVGGRGDENGTAAVTLNPGAGVVGLVFWYPDQKLDAPVPYPWTIRTKINPSRANDNQTVADCTIINAWRGISIGPEWNELHTFRNLSICALSTGFAVDSTTDIGRVSDVTVSPRVWSAGGFPGAPDETALRAWLKSHETIGADYGRSDWEYVWRLKVDGYRTGIKFRRGQRGLTNAVMADSDLTDCGTGLVVDALNGVGLAVYDCRFASTENVGFASNFNSVVQFNSCAFCDAIGTIAPPDAKRRGCFASSQWGRNRLDCVPHHGRVIVTPARQSPIRPEPMAWPRPNGNRFVDVTQLGAATNLADNTAAFQRALDSLAADGGTVYVPAGLWRFQGSLRVPTGVELRGASDVPHHTVSGGSVLLPLAGRGDANGTPFISLAARAGARGLCVWYCEQPVNDPVPYPWTVRSLGPGCWLTDVNIANSWQGVDFATHPSAGHRISYLSGAFWRTGLAVGNAAGRGWVEDTQFNPHYAMRLPPGIPVVWGDAKRAKSHHGGTQSDTMREFLHGLTFHDCADEQIRGTFLFAAREGIAFTGKNKVELLMHGTDTGTTGFVLNQSADGIVRAALAQLVPWQNDFGAESAAILLPKTDAGASTFLASQFWVDYPTLVQHGTGTTTMETFNTLSGAVLVDNGCAEVRDGVFGLGGRSHVCVSNGTARVTDCAYLNGALKVCDPDRRAVVSGSSGDSLKACKLPDAPPANVTCGPDYIQNEISKKGGIRRVSNWSCTTKEGVVRLTGHSDDPSYSFLYCDVARPSVPVYPDTVLKYRFRPLNKMSRIAAIDLAFADGAVLRMLGVGMHPGEGISKVGEWCDCAVPLAKVAGRTVTNVMVKWDSRSGGGVFDACFADIRFETPNPRENWTLKPVLKDGVVSFDPSYPHKVWYTLDGHSVDASAKTFTGALRLPPGTREFRYSPSLNDGTPSKLEFVLTCDLLPEVPWIGDGQPERNGADWYGEDPAPEFQTAFLLPKGVTKTDLTIACAGYYRLMVNGVEPETVQQGGTLAQLWTPFDKTIYANTVKMCPQNHNIKVWPQTNIVSVTLGNGFYNLPPLRFWGSRLFREEVAHGRPCFKLSVADVARPLDWKWRRTNVVKNSVYLGAEVDATRAFDAAWRDAAVVKGPKGRVVPRRAPLTGLCRKPSESLLPKKIASPKPGVQVVDFGANRSGVPEFRLRGTRKGQRIEFLYGERLNADGTVNVLTQTAGQVKRPGMGGPGAPDVACQRDVYVCGGGEVERFVPPFTWHICRYAEVRGAPPLTNATAALFFPLSARLEDSPLAANFRPARPEYEQIHELCRRTFLANVIGCVQSDCPGRERLGYGGDIVATCEAMMLNFDMKEFYLKTLQDFADEAEDDGWITETAPYVGIAVDGFGGRSGPMSWALAVPVLIDGVIRHHPDAKDRALAFYPVCARYIDLVYAKHPDGLLPTDIGDHETLDRVPNAATATAHGYEFVRLTATFAQMLGKTDDARRFTALAGKIKAAFAAKWVKDGVVANGSQGAQALGLYLGLVPADQIAAAERRLVAALEEKGYGPTTGIFTTRYMLMYLSEHGKRDLAERIVLHKGFPGWLHMLERGATTLWETWKESDNVYSNCHPMFGSVDEWILRYGGR